MIECNRWIVENIRKAEGKTGIRTVTFLDKQRIGEKLFWSPDDNEFTLFNEVGDNQIICTEQGRAFVESIKPQPQMLICGGGHISIPLIQMANLLEFTVTVLEDRPLFADHARAAGADTVICETFEDGLRRIAGNDSTYFVIVTRGHRYDMFCLEQILRKPNAYIGMIGSRRRVLTVKEQLLEKGNDKEKLELVHSPIGLNIKAETPAEIAISILGEIVWCKNERQSICGYTKEIIKFFREEWKDGIRFAMVTIIGRAGSAPRAVGTKMLVLENGRMVGTIGGGCVEAEVRMSALHAIKEGKTCITYADLSQKEAEDEGMVCGGRIELLIEA